MKVFQTLSGLSIKILAGLIFMININHAFAQNNANQGRITVSPNGHFLQYEDGKPFFWLGDTGWELFSRLKKEEIETYLENRKKKGFNVIQTLIIANTDQPIIANQYGDKPLINDDPEKPNEEYFKLVDWTIQLAHKKSLFIALLPTWGAKVMKLQATGDVIFNEKNAYSYGLFLGKRYRNYNNIIWVVGGDRPAFTDSIDSRPVWRSMIKGIKAGAGERALISYHPWGEHSSTDYWKNEDVLDINMLQSGHARQDLQVWNWVSRDFNLKPAKPILDGEPNYEDHPINWKVENGYFRDYDVRKQLYRSVFAGSAGVTYGHQAVWQFYSPMQKPAMFPDRYWTEAIDRPGAFQAGYLKKLIESRPSLKRVPDQKLIQSPNDDKGGHMTAFHDEENTYAMIYIPIGHKIEMNTSWLKAAKIKVWWYNPKTGKSSKISAMNNTGQLILQPPTTGVGNDWVLVLDDAGMKYGPPGAS